MLVRWTDWCTGSRRETATPAAPGDPTGGASEESRWRRTAGDTFLRVVASLELTITSFLDYVSIIFGGTLTTKDMFE